MKTRLLIIALIAVVTLTFMASDADAARKRKSSGTMKNISTESVADNQVRAVQQKLQQFGYNPGPVDGVPGQQTTTAIRQFQQDHGLDVDGIVGPATLAALGL